MMPEGVNTDGPGSSPGRSLVTCPGDFIVEIFRADRTETEFFLLFESCMFLENGEPFPRYGKIPTSLKLKKRSPEGTSRVLPFCSIAYLESDLGFRATDICPVICLKKLAPHTCNES